MGEGKSDTLYIHAYTRHVLFYFLSLSLYLNEKKLLFFNISIIILFSFVLQTLFKVHKNNFKNALKNNNNNRYRFYFYSYSRSLLSYFHRYYNNKIE